MSSANQYLGRYAVDEARRLRDWLSGPSQDTMPVYDHLVVMPARAESAALLKALSLRPMEARTLLVLVINERKDDQEGISLVNRGLLESLIAKSVQQVDISSEPPMGLLQRVASDERAHSASLDVLWVARCGDYALGPKQGVGWARKIGCDLAVVLSEAGRLKSPWLHWTDADARLPEAHYLLGSTPNGCVVAPFVHCPSREGEAVDRGTFLHEIWMRYYVLGLHSAGSPYAHHSLGSALSVDVSTYVAVRGVQDRLAGEDFHFLNKARKVGPVERRLGPPVEIRCRASGRVPFGTGPAARRLGEDESAPLFMAPWVFKGLSEWLSALTRIAEQGDLTPIQSLSSPVHSAVNALGLQSGLSRLIQGWGNSCRLRCLMTWFDALRTLRFLHTLRDLERQAEAGLAGGRRVWFEALSQAAFISGTYSRDDAPQAVAQRLSQQETELTRFSGPKGGWGQAVFGASNVPVDATQ